jgi:putative ABC transport system ATP-binding protein
MIRLENIRYRYPTGDFSLHCRELHLGAGDTLLIFGANGSGKSTLMQIVAGIIRPQAGQVYLGEYEVTKLSNSDRSLLRLFRIGYIWQNFALLPHLTVMNNVLLPLRLGPGPGVSRQQRERALQLLTALNLAAYARRYPEHLSRGEQQRVAICRALVSEPHYLLADEPTASLDSDHRDMVLALLRDYTSEYQCPLLLATHDPDMRGQFQQQLDMRELR